MTWVIVLLLLAILLLVIAIGLIWNVGEAINVSHRWQRQQIDELRAELEGFKKHNSSPRT